MNEKIYFTTLSLIHELSSISKDDDKFKIFNCSSDDNLSLAERLLKINQLSSDCIKALNFLQTIKFDLV